MKTGRTVAALGFLLVALSLAAQDSLADAPGAGGGSVTLHFFWGEGCPHCIRAKPFLVELQRSYPELRVESYEVYGSEENLELLRAMAKGCGTEATGVPTFVLGSRLWCGYSPDITRDVEAEVRTLLGAGTAGTPRATDGRTSAGEEKWSLPLVGAIDATATSLPILTLVLAGLDSFNPCAFFVLLFLLSLLIHVHSRPRMLLVGGTFVFFSGFLYFLFMAAWLNFFVLVGQRAFVTTVAAGVALFIAAVNVKDFFFFERGVSLVIPEEARPKLLDRMRKIVQARSLPMMLAGTVALAAAANTYELLCTAGFPMVYTRALTLHALPPTGYYLYLVFYNVVYVVPLAAVVLFFVVTLGSRKLTEWQGRLLKLVSGCMMGGLGTVLLVKPELLGSALVSVSLLCGSLLVAWVLASAVRRREERSGGRATG